MTYLINWFLIGFVFFGLFSPGPNVILLTASGARFGFRPTLPHIFGVAIGVGFIAGATGLGVGALLATQPELSIVLKVLACAWMLRMAHGLWHARPGKEGTKDRPFTFVEAVLFQWVNPKVWAVALSASAYVTELSLGAQILALALSFSTLNLFVCFFWTSAGELLARLLRSPRAWQIFNRIMAGALGLFALLVFL